MMEVKLLIRQGGVGEAGEVVTVPDRKAARYLDKGIAEAVDVTPEPEAPKPKPKPTRAKK